MKLVAVLTVIGCALAAWLGGWFRPLPPGARWE